VTSPPAAGPIDVGRILDEGSWSGYQRLLVLLTASSIVFDGLDLQLLGVAVPSMMREWKLSRAAFATVFASGLFGMMIGGALAGMVGDRFGRRAALIGSVLTFGALTVATAAVNDLTALGVLRFFTGLGLGGALPNAAALASEYVPRRHRPFAVTLTIVCIPLGGTLAGVLGLQVLPVHGWRTLYVIGGIIPIATALMLFALLPESPRFLARHSRRWPELVRSLRRMGHAVAPDASFVDPTEQAVAQGSMRALLGKDFRADTLALWGAYFSCMLGVYLGFNWVPAMLTGAGMSPTVASTGITAYNLGGVFGAVCGALAFARLGSKPTMLGMAAGSIVGALVLRSMPIGPTSAAEPIVGMLGITGGLINAVQTTMYALAAQVYPVGVRATGVGAAASVGRAGAIASTYAGAWALEAGGSGLFFLLVAAAMLAALVSLALVRRHIPAPTRGMNG
jgi:AAHS family 4-hydroxybenzoate transporter-like MFS transporter